MRANLLIDSLPDTITVDGREHPVNTDFRTGVLFEMLMYDETVSSENKCIQIFDLYFDKHAKEVPLTKEAFDTILAFYRCERQENRAAKRIASRKKQQPKRIYDFDHDDAYIYAAFMAQYGIDLNSINCLHWWKFQALFTALNNEQKIVEIMGYRATDLSQIKSKQERERITRLKAIYSLPNTVSREDKIAHAASVFSGGLST